MEKNGQEQQKNENLPGESKQPGQENEAPEDVLDAEIVTEDEQEPEPDAVQQELREAQQKVEEYLDLLRRTQADFVNYRRRMNQEQAETRTTAQVALLHQLLPVLDDFERALEVIPA